MRKVRLEKIEIHNFKGIGNLVLDFKSQNATISGANGVGKTTVYDAYLWCLFGKTSEANQILQPVDKNNEVRHKIETYVTVYISVDGQEAEIKRSISEKWRKLGSPEEKFVGTEIQRYYNGVPLSQRDFQTKLQGIAELAIWAMLSDINAFMALSADEKRKILLSMAGEFNEEVLVKKYNAIQEAYAKGKSIDELLAQEKRTKRDAEQELKQIPAMLAAQDNLRIDIDFVTLEAERKRIDAEVGDINRQLEASSEELEKDKETRQKINETEAQIIEIKSSAARKSLQKRQELEAKVLDCRKEQADISTKLSQARKELSDKENAKVKTKEAIEEYKVTWRTVNELQFHFTSSDICPVCGRPYDEEMKENERKHAIAEFNLDKSSQLERISEKVKVLKEQLLVQETEIQETKMLESNLTQELEVLEEKLESCTNEQQNYHGEVPEGLSELEERLNNLKSELYRAKDGDNYQLKERRYALTQKRDEIVKALAGKEINDKIEQHKTELEERARNLAQIISDADGVIYQVGCFKKEKIDAIEGKVNSLFSIVKWKFFSKNVSNDEYQDVCIAVVNGIDFANLNRAKKMNAKIDVVNGLCNASGISIPVFVDGAESCTNYIASENQIILLQVKAESCISITF